MKLLTIDAGYFKADGGALFGVVPKVLWSKLMEADENNMVPNAFRLLLIEHKDHKILVDTGLGDKQDEKFFRNYGVYGERNLEKVLGRYGYSLGDITDVILTHLHADHSGGAVSRSGDGILYPTFPNATYWVSRDQWEHALNPNFREKAAFLPENFLPLQEAGVLRLVEKPGEILPDIFVEFHYGHTRGLMEVRMFHKGVWFVYPSDFIPTAYHVYEPYVMSYDICAEKTLQEKETFFEWAVHTPHCIIFNHDPYNEAGIIFKDKKGHKVKETFRLQEFLNRL